VNYTYLLKNEKNEVTDMVSFYSVPALVIGHEKYKALKAAYTSFAFATTKTLSDLLMDACIIAKNMEYDVMRSLN